MLIFVSPLIYKWLLGWRWGENEKEKEGKKR